MGAAGLTHLIDLLSAIATAAAQGGLHFAVEGECTNCPGAESTLIAAAWANIAYMHHAALLYFVSFSAFGAWAPLLYVVAAICALIGVATNNAPRNYIWFILGPALYGFLIGATQDVQGVGWVVAGYPANQQEVWRDAETGLKNSPLMQIDRYKGMQVDKYKGPSKEYAVAMPLLFLDELFSTTSNLLVGWTGLYRQLGTGGNNTNLAKQAQNGAGSISGARGEGEGPWHLLSNLKSPMVENIVSATVRNPDLRDAFITFLASECGDEFKKGIDSGAYNAATMSRGGVLPMTIFKDREGQAGDNNFTQTSDLPSPPSLKNFKQPLNNTWMPTPPSLRRLLHEGGSGRGSQGGVVGSFTEFSPMFNNGPESTMSLHYNDEILCSDYLYTIIQGLRHETGHAYHQLVRTAPDGFTETSLLYTLFYGWNIRHKEGDEYADENEIKWFTQNLILVHMLKNELQFAPQITSVDQKFAPADQIRQYSQAYMGTMGAKNKFGELYNWAIMMPYVQGILLYVIIVAYPLAAMMMILPGYWKSFFTWITFFAWVKMWDVGFAVVQVLERSVWAMIGNHSNMARVASMLIQTSWRTDGITVECNGAAGGGGSDVSADLNDQCAVPKVTNGDAEFGEGGDQDENKAFFLLDKALLLSAAADLDVSNGYYIYIMTALYFAVPAVTGQLILGAKAGLGNIATGVMAETGRDAGNAARSGFQSDMGNRISTGFQMESQAAYGKAMRKGGLAAQALGLENDNLNIGREQGGIDAKSGAYSGAAGLANSQARSVQSALATYKALQGDDDAKTPKVGPDKKDQSKPVPGGIPSSASGSRGSASGSAGTGTTASGGGFLGNAASLVGNLPGIKQGIGAAKAVGAYAAKPAAAGWNAMKAAGDPSMHPRLMDNAYQQQAHAFDANATKMKLDNDISRAALGQRSNGNQLQGQRTSQSAQYQAELAAWDARNNSANRYAGLASVYGAGGISAGQKPTNMTGMAGDGTFGLNVQDAYGYAGTFAAQSSSWGKNTTKSFGGESIGHNFAIQDWASAGIEATARAPKEMVVEVPRALAGSKDAYGGSVDNMVKKPK